MPNKYGFEGGPAFTHFDGTDNHKGLAWRDVFAAFAMHAILSHKSQEYSDDEDLNFVPLIDADVLAREAYDYADAMLVESAIHRELPQ